VAYLIHGPSRHMGQEFTITQIEAWWGVRGTMEDSKDVLYSPGSVLFTPEEKALVDLISDSPVATGHYEWVPVLDGAGHVLRIVEKWRE